MTNIIKSFLVWIEEKHRQVQFALTLVTLFLVIATFLMAGFMFWQAQILKNSVTAQRDSVDVQKDSVDAQKESVRELKRSVETQIEELSLSKRPYVYLEIKNVRIKPRIEIKADNKPSTHYMVQADLEFKNEGDIPAVINEIKYFVTTDKDKRHLDTPAYFEENLGSYPYPTIIFPKQENLRFTYGADCSTTTERIYFNVVLAYKGYKEDSNYWYSFISKYATIGEQAEQKIKLADGTEIQSSITAFTIIPLQLEGDWDRNKNVVRPEIFIPDWESEEKQITKQRDFLR